MKSLSIILLALILGSCGLAYTPKHAFTTPYTIDQIKLAEKYVTGVEIVPWRQMGRSYGNVTQDGVIRIRDDMKGDNYNDVYWHEVSHLYDYHIAGKPWNNDHDGWIAYSTAR